MAVDLPEVHAAALDTTRAYVAGVGAVQWGDASPCPDWDVRTLVNHIVSGNWWASELGAGVAIDEVGNRLDGDLLGADPIGVYDASAAAAAATFREAGAMERPCAVSYGPVPGEVYCGHRFMDVLVHGWDVARATGQDTALPPDLVNAAIEVVTPQAAMLGESGMFATDVDVPADGDAQTRLLAMLGRRP
jgi:uncharacterized protein (TIGR03086 family)